VGRHGRTSSRLGIASQSDEYAQIGANRRMGHASAFVNRPCQGPTFGRGLSASFSCRNCASTCARVTFA
jgi:hypothetical protein